QLVQQLGGFPVVSRCTQAHQPGHQPGARPLPTSHSQRRLHHAPPMVAARAGVPRPLDPHRATPRQHLPWPILVRANLPPTLRTRRPLPPDARRQAAPRRPLQPAVTTVLTPLRQALRQRRHGCYDLLGDRSRHPRAILSAADVATIGGLFSLTPNRYPLTHTYTT